MQRNVPFFFTFATDSNGLLNAFTFIDKDLVLINLSFFVKYYVKVWASSLSLHFHFIPVISYTSSNLVQLNGSKKTFNFKSVKSMISIILAANSYLSKLQNVVLLDGGRKVEHVGSASSVPRLQPFSPGQVYNFSKAQQVHVLPASNTLQADSLT